MPWAMRSGAGAASAVARASRCARTTDGCLVEREDQASPSMVQPAGIK